MGTWIVWVVVRPSGRVTVTVSVVVPIDEGTSSVTVTVSPWEFTVVTVTSVTEEFAKVSGWLLV